MSLRYLPRRLLCAVIVAYQRTISPDHGWMHIFFPHGVCKFHPTCSKYGYQAVKRFGSLKGGMMAARRVLRCHPWSMGGNDPLV